MTVYVIRLCLHADCYAAIITRGSASKTVAGRGDLFTHLKNPGAEIEWIEAPELMTLCLLAEVGLMNGARIL